MSGSARPAQPYLCSPIDLMVKHALAALEAQPSNQWRDAVRDLETGRPVRLELSLGELALLLEIVDFSSGRLEDIEAMKFWDHRMRPVNPPSAVEVPA